MTTIRAGDLWIADIPFTNGAASKKRPVLILWIDGRDVVVAAVTSAHPRTQTDVVLTIGRQAVCASLRRFVCRGSIVLKILCSLAESDAYLIEMARKLKKFGNFTLNRNFNFSKV